MYVGADAGAGQLVERRDAVILPRVVLGELVALHLPRERVEEHRALHRAELLQDLEERRQIVAVDRAVVLEAELLEEDVRNHQVLHPLLDPAHELPRLATGGKLAEEVPDLALELAVSGRRRELREIPRDGAHVGRDRHRVVVQHDEDVRARDAGLVQPLVREPARERAVSDHRDHRVLLASEIARAREAEPRGDRRGRVRGAEGVVGTLDAPREAREAGFLAERVERVVPSREDLVAVRLMPDVPDHDVARGVEGVVEREGELDRAEARGEVSAGLRNHLDDALADLRGHLRQRLGRKPLQIARALDRAQMIRAHMPPGGR